MQKHRCLTVITDHVPSLLSVSCAARRGALACLIFLIAACSSPIGEDFADVDAIGLSVTWQDWVIVGRFGPTGPFSLVQLKDCEVSEPCSFSHNGQGHTYNEFDGFKLTVLRLESPQGHVSHVVLRSKQKFAEDAS